jgi:hypothetical protein
MPFKPGQSGNPNGGPRREKRFSTILANLLESSELDASYSFTDDNGVLITKRIKVKADNGKTLFHALALALIAKGLAGEIPAIKEAIDRLEGKAEATMTINQEAKSPLTDEQKAKIADDLISRNP